MTLRPLEGVPGQRTGGSWWREGREEGHGDAKEARPDDLGGREIILWGIAHSLLRAVVDDIGTDKGSRGAGATPLAVEKMGARLFVGSEAGSAAGHYSWVAEGNIVLSQLGQWRSLVCA